MPHRVTVVMYHYVRDLRRSRFPEIKGLDVSDFVGQLAYIQRNYEIVRMQDVIDAAYDDGTELPERALLLTFDDGYADHYQTVFPILDRLGIEGSFFPPAKAILEKNVLDVNKIHFSLAAVEDKLPLVEFIEAKIQLNRSQYELSDLSTYRDSFFHPTRWDSPEIAYIKRILQKGLPEKLRNEITDELFGKFVSSDEAAFAHELYMSTDQLECMIRNGMHVGSHSYDHYWLDSLGEDDQLQQIEMSMDFLNRLGCDIDNWTMCYPYGGYNETLLNLLREKGCKIGLTTEVAIADLVNADPLKISRLDTNDLPRSSGAPSNDWTLSG